MKTSTLLKLQILKDTIFKALHNAYIILSFTINFDENFYSAKRAIINLNIFIENEVLAFLIDEHCSKIKDTNYQNVLTGESENINNVEK